MASTLVDLLDKFSFLPPKFCFNRWFNDNIYQLYYIIIDFNVLFWSIHNAFSIILLHALSQNKIKNNIVHKYHPSQRMEQNSVNMWPWEQFGCAGLGFMTHKTGYRSVITTLFLSKTLLEEVKLTEKFTVYFRNVYIILHFREQRNYAFSVWSR